MSLFAEKCVRCGHRTKESYDNRPTCGPCRRSLELKLAAAGEQRRVCPVDGAVMTKTVAHMMVIDRCPACQGVWLDAGELEHLTDDVAQESMMALARGVYSTT